MKNIYLNSVWKSCERKNLVRLSFFLSNNKKCFFTTFLLFILFSIHISSLSVNCPNNLFRFYCFSDSLCCREWKCIFILFSPYKTCSRPSLEIDSCLSASRGSFKDYFTTFILMFTNFLCTKMCINIMCMCVL